MILCVRWTEEVFVYGKARSGLCRGRKRACDGGLADKAAGAMDTVVIDSKDADTDNEKILQIQVSSYTKMLPLQQILLVVEAWTVFEGEAIMDALDVVEAELRDIAEYRNMQPLER